MSDNFNIDEQGNVGIQTDTPGGLIGLRQQDIFISVQGDELVFADGQNTTPITLSSLVAGNTNNQQPQSTFNDASFTGNTSFPNGEWDASGRIGINTTDPAADLDVAGSGVFSAGLAAADLTLDDTGAPGLQFGQGNVSVKSDGNNLIFTDAVAGTQTLNDLVNNDSGDVVPTNNPSFTGTLTTENLAVQQQASFGVQPGAAGYGPEEEDQVNDAFVGTFSGIWIQNNWQSFTSGISGRLTAFTFYGQGQGGTCDFKLYRGEGTDGELLLTQTIEVPTSGNQKNTLNEAINVSEGEVFTFWIDSSVGLVETNRNSGNYSRGTSSGNNLGGDADMMFKTWVEPAQETVLTASTTITPEGRVGIRTSSTPQLDLEIGQDASVGGGLTASKLGLGGSEATAMIGLGNPNVYIDSDGQNLIFSDPTAGTKTLEELVNTSNGNGVPAKNPTFKGKVTVKGWMNITRGLLINNGIPPIQSGPSNENNNGGISIYANGVLQTFEMKGSGILTSLELYGGGSNGTVTVQLFHGKGTGGHLMATFEVQISNGKWTDATPEKAIFLHDRNTYTLSFQSDDQAMILISKSAKFRGGVKNAGDNTKNYDVVFRTKVQPTGQGVAMTEMGEVQVPRTLFLGATGSEQLIGDAKGTLSPSGGSNGNGGLMLKTDQSCEVNINANDKPSDMFYVTRGSQRKELFRVNEKGKVGILTQSPGGALGIKDKRVFLDVDSNTNLVLSDATGRYTLSQLSGAKPLPPLPTDPTIQGNLHVQGNFSVAPDSQVGPVADTANDPGTYTGLQTVTSKAVTQSMVFSRSGSLASLDILMGAFDKDMTVTVFEGEGTSGTALASQVLPATMSGMQTWTECQFANPPSIEEGVTYTIEFAQPVDAGGVYLSWYITNNNAYAAGVLEGDSVPANTDLCFRTYIGTMSGLFVDDNYQVGIGTDTPNASLDVRGAVQVQSLTELSDLSLKTAIKPLEASLDKVLQLRGVHYQWKHNAAGPQTGMIAQEVEDILPELVRTGTDGIKSLEYSKLTAYLVEAIKALHTDNTHLRQTVEALQQRMNQLPNVQ